MEFSQSPRRLLTLLILSALLLVGCGKTDSSEEEMKRPNIIFVMTDDHTHHQMSLTGKAVIQTPNMDRLAAEGVWFKNAFCTNSLCARLVKN